MKFILDDFEQPTAEQLFVDRIEPRQAFWRHFEEAQKGPDHPLVVHYYGVGGIGKSSLHSQLAKELAERQPGAKSLCLDFDFVERREPHRVLALAERKLADAYGFSFPLFDVACYTYLCRIGEDAQASEAQSLVGSSPVLTFLCDAASMVPGASMVAGILKLVDEGVAVARNWFSDKKQMLRRLETVDIRLLRRQLPAYFAADLRENLRGEREPFVIFLDTYEKLVDEFASVGDPLQNDWWLRSRDGLIPRLPGALWVLGGREQLKWPALDGADAWDGVLHQYLLGTLAQADAEEFLRAAGVAQEAVRSQIFRLSGGLPVSLDLYVEQYRARGEVAGDVPPAALHERVVRYMSDGEKSACYLLAYLGRWTQESAARAARQAGVALPPDLYDKLCSFSFVRREAGGVCAMMRPVAEVLRANCPAALGRALAAVPLEEQAVPAQAAAAPAEEAPAAAQPPAAAAPEPQEAPEGQEAQLPPAPRAITQRAVAMALRAVADEETCIDWLLEHLEEPLDAMRRRMELDSYFAVLAPLRQFAREKAPGGVLETMLDGFDGIGLYSAGQPRKGEAALRRALEALCAMTGPAARIARHTVSVQYFSVARVRFDYADYVEIAPRLWQIQQEEGSAVLAAATARRLAEAYDNMDWPEQAQRWRERGREAPAPAAPAEPAREAPAGGPAPAADEARLEAMREELGQRLSAGEFSPADRQAVEDLLEEGLALAGKVYGPDSLEAFRWQCEAGNAYGRMGDGAAMAEAFRQAVALCARFSGEDSGTWAVLRGMELQLQAMMALSDDWGRLEGIAAEAQPVAALLERRLGPRRSDTQNAKYLCRIAEGIRGLTVGQFAARLREIQADPAWAASEESLGYAAGLLDVIDSLEGSCDGQMVTAVFGPGWADGGQEGAPESAPQAAPEAPARQAPAGSGQQAPAQDGSPAGLIRAWMAESQPAGLYTAVTGIPEKKLRNALKSYGGGAEGGQVAALLDTTVLGSGKSGLLVLEDRVVYKDLLGKKGSVPLAQLAPFTREDLRKGDGNFLVLNAAGAPAAARFSPETPDRALAVLNRLVALLQTGRA